MKINIEPKKKRAVSKGDLIVIKHLISGDTLHYIVIAESDNNGVESAYKFHCLESSSIVRVFESKTMLGLITNLKLDKNVEIIEIIPRDELSISRTTN
ncbi:hypothetical protein [Peribacillus asahii]|uniref:hypothetical protein n=1 Tax=Peribacillus asahii TaxID=228899 RepID=UPI0037F2210C